MSSTQTKISKCYMYLIRDLQAAPDKASLLGDRHQGPGVSSHRHRLVTVRVPEDYVGDPEQTHLNTVSTYSQALSKCRIYVYLSI